MMKFSVWKIFVMAMLGLVLLSACTAAPATPAGEGLRDAKKGVKFVEFYSPF
jgi:hypothetical protein